MTEQDDLSRRRLRTWIRLLRITRGTERHLREFLRVEHDTTLPRFDVMAALHRHQKPMKMSELSKRLLVSNGNATAVVNRLEKDGLAQRLPSGNDKRVVLVGLTKEGLEQFETLAAANEIEVNNLFSKLGHEELDAIRDLLKRVEGSRNDDDV